MPLTSMRILLVVSTLFISLNLAYAVPSFQQEIEPNDSQAAANDAGKTVLFSSNLHQALVSGNMISGTDTSDDYFEYYLNQGDSISVTAEQKNGVQLRLYLKDSSLALKDQDASISGSYKRISNYIAQSSGNHYIVCNYWSGSGNYDLNITSNEAGFHERELLTPSNNSTATAEYIQQIDDGSGNLVFEGVVGTIFSADDDYYFFQMREGQTLDIGLRTFNDLSPKVELLAGNLSVLQSFESASLDYDVPFSPVSITEPGPYYLKVSGNSGHGLLGSYYISASIASTPEPGVTGEVEPNNSSAQTTPLNLSLAFPSSNIYKASAAGSIGLLENGTTDDYYSFSGNVGDQVTITNDQLDTGVTTRLYLYAPNGSTQLSYDGDTTNDNRITSYTLVNDGEHKIRIEFYGGTGGAYELNVVLNKSGYNEEEMFNDNDTMANAEVIPFDNSSGNILNLAEVTGTIDTAEEDWYFIYLRENQTIDLNIETAGSLMANVELFAPDSSLISSTLSTAPDQQLNLPSHVTVEPGSYYLRLTAISGDGYHANYKFNGDIVGEASHGFDIEPNDSVAAATPLDLVEIFTSSNIFKASAVGTINLKENSPTDDYYKFSGNIGDQVTITNDQLDSGITTRLYLYAPNGSTQLGYDGDTTNDNRISSFTLTSDGDHFVRVEYYGGTGGVYEINVVLNKGGYNEEEHFNQNNTQGSAEIIPFSSSSGNILEFSKVAATLDDGDEDWFFVYLRENQELNLNLETTGSLMANVELFSPSSNLISSMQSSVPNETLTIPTHTTIAPGSYYLRVTSLTGDGYHANYTFVGGVAGEASHGFDVEPNDSVASATPLSLAELFPNTNIFKASAVGSIGLKENSSTDDYFKFSGNIGDQVTITNDQLDTGITTRLYLYAPNGSTQLGYDGDTTNDNRITSFTLTSDGDHFIRIEYYGGAGGVYELNVVLNKGGFNEEERFNQNDTQGSAEIIPFAAASSNVLDFSKVAGTLDNGDEDWFFLYLRESQILDINMQTTGSLMANVELFAPDSSLISSLQASTPNESLHLPSHTTVDPGSYYLRITSISGEGYHANYTFIGNVIGEASHGFDIEPNDSSAAANPLTLTELFPTTNIYKASAVGSIGLKENSPTDDYFSFSANIGDQVTITTDQLDTGLTTRLYLYAPNGSTQLGYDGDTTNDNRLSAITITNDGEHKVRVEHYGGAGGTYEINVIVNKGGYNEEETFSENDTQATAEIIPFSTASSNVLNLAYAAATLDTGEEDWFYIYLREHQTLSLDIETTGSLMANVELYDPSSNLISSVQSSMPLESLSLPDHFTNQPGSYYLKISALSGSGYHANYTFIGDVIGDASHGFDIEPNDSTGTATPLNLSEIFPGSNVIKASAVGSIGLKENSSTDDYYSFSGNIGDQITITNDQLDSGITTRLYLYAPNGSTQLAYDSDTTNDNRLSAITLTNDGIHFIRVEYYGGAGGSYEINVVKSKDGWLEREKFSNNDSFANAEFIGVNNDPSHNHPLISTTGILDNASEDVYQFTVLNGMTLNLDLEITGGWTGKMELYRDQVLIDTITGTSPDQNLALTYTEIGNNHEYHIKITNLDFQHYHALYLIKGSLSGDASRTVDNKANATISGPQDISFSLNAFTNANEASAIGHFSEGETSTQSNHYFRVPVSVGDNLNFHLNNPSGMDLDIYLYDNVEGLYASDAAGTYADKSFSEQNISLGGNFFIRVDHQSGAGVYSLQVSDATANQPPMVTTFSPNHDRRALIPALGVKIRYDQELQLGSSGNIVLFDLTKNQPVHVITTAANNALSISGNLVLLNLKQEILAYDPEPFTEFSLTYEAGLLEATDSTMVVDFPSPWTFRLGDFQRIDSGETTTLLIRNDQDLWGFGDSHFGESGNIEIPISSPELDTRSWWDVSLGAHHTLAITHTGDLYSFGDNRRGQLNQSGNNLGIVMVSGGNSAFIDISAGIEHSLAIKKNGRLVASGKNHKGQLGLGDQIDRSSFNEISGFFWNNVAAGPDFSIGITFAGALHAWGNTSWDILNGQDIALTPIQIGSDTDWQSLAAGYRHALATKEDKTLWAWGNNLKGQLGTGNNSSTATPTQIASNVKAIAAGAGHSLYIDDIGDLYSFGQNNLGQLGLGDNNDRNTPQWVNLNGEQARFISAGPFTSTVIAVSGNVYAFGKDSTGTNPNTPVQVFSAE